MIEQLDFSYMTPPRDAYNIKHPDSYIVQGNPPKYLRMIYEDVAFLPFEEQKIDEFKQELSKGHPNITLPEDWKKSDYLKILQCSGFNKKEAVKTLQNHLSWRNDPLNHKIHKDNLPLLEKGIIYVNGRDRQYRPIVILNAYLINPKENTQESICQAISYLLGQVVKHMMIPYHIENWIMIIETNKIGISSLPLKALGKIIGSMQTNFCGRLQKMFLLNPSSGLNFIWKAVSAFIDERTLSKIGFLTSKDLKKIQDLVDPLQLEVKYDGKLPNLTKFWPPVNIDPKVPELINLVEIEVIQVIVQPQVIEVQKENLRIEQFRQGENGQQIEQEEKPHDQKSQKSERQSQKPPFPNNTIPSNRDLESKQQSQSKLIVPQDNIQQYEQTPSSNPDEQFQSNPMFSPSPQLNQDQEFKNDFIEVKQDDEKFKENQHQHTIDLNQYVQELPIIKENSNEELFKSQQKQGADPEQEEHLKSVTIVKELENKYPFAMQVENNQQTVIELSVSLEKNKKTDLIEVNQSPKPVFDAPKSTSKGCCSSYCSIF